MNPFLEKPFLNWSQIGKSDAEVRNKQHRILRKSDFDFDDLVELFLYFEKKGKFNNSGNLGALLYYFYNDSYVTSKLEYKPNSSKYLAGRFGDAFYNKLNSVLNDRSKAFLFDYLPPNLQSDDLLKNYFKNNIEASFSNFKRAKKPSEKVIEELLDIAFVPVVRSLPKSYWTKKLKEKVLKKDKIGLIYMSEKVITKKEVIDFLRTEPKAKDMYNQLFRNSSFPKVFQEDQEIRAEFILLQKSPRDISLDFYSECTYDFYKYYLEHVKPTLSNNKFLDLIPTNIMDNTLKDLAIKKLPYEALVSLRDLSKEQLKALYNSAKNIRVGNRSIIVQLINTMKQNNLFKLDMLHDFDEVTFKDLEWTLSDGDLKKFMTPDVVDYYFKQEDEDFFKTKKSMKFAGTLNKEKLYILLKNLSYAKLKSRINFRVTDDDFAYLYLTTRTDKINEKTRHIMMNNLVRLLADGYINISDTIKDDLDDLPLETTFSGWKAAKDIFLF